MARGAKPTKLYYEIDKNGDVVIVLAHSVAIWQTKEVYQMQKEGKQIIPSNNSFEHLHR